MNKIFLLIFCLVATHTWSQKTDTDKIKSTVTNFYKWYHVNWQKISSFQLYTGKGGKDTPPYHIDWKVANRYFNFLRKNVSYVNEEFIQAEKKHFQYADSMFRVYPDDEIAIGFDYDRFTNSQEDPKWFLDVLTKKSTRWVINKSGNQAMLTLVEKNADKNNPDNTEFMCLHLRKAKEIWKISKIGCKTDKE